MDTTDFQRALTADGFADSDTRQLEANRHTPEHQHPFEVRALVTQGEITLGVAGESRAYRVGEVFTMAADCRHTETVGPDGVTYLVGRRHKAVAA